MDLRRSKLTMYLALLALAAFLIFWLVQEYERGKRSMMVATHLEVATDIISDQHEDLEGLMAELKRLGNGERSDLQNLQWEEGRFQMDSGIHFEQDLVVQVIDGDLNDTNTRVVLKYFNADSVDSTFAHVRAGVGRRIQVEEPSTEAALLKIWPQSIFALLLFGLFVVGVRLMQTNNRREQALIQERNSLISNMTHELKTPVATIAVALEAIQDFNVRNDRSKTDQYLGAARKELARLSDSVDMVMDLSRIDQNAAIYEKEVISLVQLLTEVQKLMIPQLEHKGISMELVGTSTLRVNADPRHLRNAFINLVDNAVKYGLPDGSITVDLGSQSGMALIAIKDDGIGISAEHHDAVFNRFFRVNDQDLHNVKGDGLGLSYVKEIIEVHGGSVTLQSEKGKGSRFEIKLPLHDG